MIFDYLPYVIALAIACAIPGPGVTASVGTALGSGFRPALVFVTGIVFGDLTYLTFAVLGLTAIATVFSGFFTVVKFAGAAYLLYLAWRIATAVGVHGEGRGRPFTFLQAAAFQWVNAKAWVMAVGAVTAYAGLAAYPANVAFIGGMFAVLGTVSSLTWLTFGTALKRLVSDPRAVRIFNLVMATLLAASLIPVFLEG